MPCGKQTTRPQRSHRTRDLIASLFSKGNVATAAKHRLSQCLHASDCGRVCERFVKAPGKIVWCVDIKTGVKVELYEALEHASFHCPRGLF